jgi:hypothetical protein
MKSVYLDRQRFLILCCALMALCRPGAGQVAGRSAAPILTCKIESPNHQRDTSVIEVSNLKRLTVSIELSGNGNPLAPITIRPQSGTSRASQTGNIELAVRRLGPTRQQTVPVAASIAGTERTPNNERALLSVELPIDEARRRTNIEHYLEWVETDAAKKERASPEAVKEFKDKRAEMMRAFERIYVENQVGTFELVCRYSSDLPEFWRGEVRSGPVVFRVKDDGAFFDQPGFGRASSHAQN